MTKGKNSKSESKEERQFNQEHYGKLMECSKKGPKGIEEWNKWRKSKPNEDILLEGAELSRLHLQGVDLERAKLREATFLSAELQGAKLYNANLKNAKLYKTHLEGAKLRECELQGTEFCNAYLQDADFSRAIVDGRTEIWNCKIDEKTKFEGVGLGNIRIYPKEKQLLEYNIRRINWEQWYRYKDWDETRPNKKRNCIVRLLMFIIRGFWSISNYGTSTWRIIIWFFGLALFFAAIYSNCAYWQPPGVVSNLEVEAHLPLWHYFLLVLLRPVYFSIVTMTTLGFGDMFAHDESVLGHLLLTIQVILGYVLLGTLVTRLNILFTAGGPAGSFTPVDKETKELLAKLKEDEGN